MASFRELLLQLGGGSFYTGDWFALRDGDTGWWSHKENRPYVLVDDYSGTGPAKLFGRTRYGRGEIEHQPHAACDPRCIIDVRGRIRTYQLSVDGALLPERYTCHEPDDEIVEQIVAAVRT